MQIGASPFQRATQTSAVFRLSYAKKSTCGIRSRVPAEVSVGKHPHPFHHGIGQANHDALIPTATSMSAFHSSIDSECSSSLDRHMLNRLAPLPPRGTDSFMKRGNSKTEIVPAANTYIG